MAVPCVPIPIPTLPAIPAPFSLTPPAIPQPSTSFNACCVNVSLGDLLPPVALPPFIVNPALVTTLRQASKAAQSWLQNLPIRCPRS